MSGIDLLELNLNSKCKAVNVLLSFFQDSSSSPEKNYNHGFR